MRILHALIDMDPKKGGICEGLRAMIEGLTDIGLQSEVVSLDLPDAPFIDGEPFLIHALGTGWGPWRYNPKLLPWLVDNLHRFDVVILHGLWLYHGYAVSKAMRLLKRQSLVAAQKEIKIPKLFIMPHGMLDPYFQKAAGRKLKAIRNWSYWKLIEGKVINEADGLFFTSEKEKRLARKPFSPYRPKRETVVGLGVKEPPPFNSCMREKFLEKCPHLGNSSYFLFLSRIHEKKGLDLLISAYQKMVERKSAIPELSFQENGFDIPKLIIAGPGLETPYGQKIRKLTLETPRLRSSVFFTGMLTGDAKWGAFYGCESFVLTSHQENFGVAVVEAMACGKAVLISNQVNIWQEIKGEGGGIVAENTVAGTASLLKGWKMLTREQKLTMGRVARICFERNFSIGRVANGILEALSHFEKAGI